MKKAKRLTVSGFPSRRSHCPLPSHLLTLHIPQAVLPDSFRHMGNVRLAVME